MNLQSVWIEFVLAFHNVTRQYRRSLFGIFAVTFGVIGLVLAGGFIDWNLVTMRDLTIHTGLGHIQVMRRGYLDDGQAAPMHYLMPEHSAVSRAIARFPTVRTMAPRLAFTGLLSHGKSTISFIGEGMDPKAELKVSSRLLITAGKNMSASAPDGIILGTGLAANAGVKVGDKVVLLVNLPGGGINAVECRVRGLFDTISKAYDDSALRVPLPVAQKLLRVTGVHRWILLLDKAADTAPTLKALRQRFSGSDLQFVPWYDLADAYKKTVALYTKQVNVVEFIIAVIIVLSITNTMTMNVLERTSEIGTCLAIGRNRRQILRQFVFEGLAIGLIGGAIGLVAGWLLAALISYIGIPMPPAPGVSQGYIGRIFADRALLSNAFVLAVCTALLASAYPAWRASRLEIVDALRHTR